MDLNKWFRDVRLTTKPWWEIEEKVEEVYKWGCLSCGKELPDAPGYCSKHDPWLFVKNGEGE